MQEQYTTREQLGNQAQLQGIRRSQPMGKGSSNELVSRLAGPKITLTRPSTWPSKRFRVRAYFNAASFNILTYTFSRCTQPALGVCPKRPLATKNKTIRHHTTQRALWSRWGMGCWDHRILDCYPMLLLLTFSKRLPLSMYALIPFVSATIAWCATTSGYCTSFSVCMPTLNLPWPNVETGAKTCMQYRRALSADMVPGMLLGTRHGGSDQGARTSSSHVPHSSAGVTNVGTAAFRAYQCPHLTVKRAQVQVRDVKEGRVRNRECAANDRAAAVRRVAFQEHAQEAPVSAAVALRKCGKVAALCPVLGLLGVFLQRGCPLERTAGALN